MRNVSLYLMALFYLGAGTFHFIHPPAYLGIMPAYLPWHRFLVFFSGGLEMLLGMLLIPYQTRVMAAWGIIILLILVFPANVQMALNYYRSGNPYFWLSLIRLPIQGLLIWWAFRYTRKVPVKRPLQA